MNETTETVVLTKEEYADFKTMQKLVKEKDFDNFYKNLAPKESSLNLPVLPTRRDVIKGRDNPSGTLKVAETLVPQMGSDNQHLAKGLIDMRKFAVLSQGDQVSLMHFSYRGKVDKIRYYSMLTEWILNSSPSVDGLGRKQVISTVEASRGGRSEPKLRTKPNVFARKLWNRDWKDKAEARGETIIE